MKRVEADLRARNDALRKATDTSIGVLYDHAPGVDISHIDAVDRIPQMGTAYVEYYGNHVGELHVVTLNPNQKLNLSEKMQEFHVLAHLGLAAEASHFTGEGAVGLVNSLTLSQAGTTIVLGETEDNFSHLVDARGHRGLLVTALNGIRLDNGLWKDGTSTDAAFDLRPNGVIHNPTDKAQVAGIFAGNEAAVPLLQQLGARPAVS